MTTLTVAEANALVDKTLGAVPRATHSRTVARLMRGLAMRLGGDPDLWEVVGLCHDLDYFEVKGDWTRHGVVAAAWLKDQLPEDALQAIAAHDHRTGVIAETALADGLVLADTLTGTGERFGFDVLGARLAASDLEGLRADLGERSYNADTIGRLAAKLSIELPGLAALIRG